MTIPDISPEIFFDADRASRTLFKLHELFITSGSRYAVEEFSQALSIPLRTCPDPDLAVTSLLRFAEATMSTTSLFNDLVAYPVLMDVLIKILSSSQYFADILVRDPELFRWLTASDALVKPRSKEFLRDEVQRAINMFQKPERKLDSLKRLYRREILRIGARDILGEAQLQTLTEELSHLADVLVDASCAIAFQQMSSRFPNPPQTPYAVLGLGKLGGSELNYSSDIDIIFVYNEEGELTDANGRTRTYHEYFNAFFEKLVLNLTQSSTEGHLYRVDTRLRPESGAGPLARTAQSYLLYYESRGEMWERQMLIKARPIAGDIEFGEKFIAQLEPFVYPRSFFQNPRESIARIKARIEAAIAGEENVKLRAGGIRDIEFIVQALQLINGGKNKEIRSRNTLEAVQQLAKATLLSGHEQKTLTDAYMFFRTIEHRLQTMLNTQTHEIPGNTNELAALAKRVGLATADELQKKSALHLAAVRKIFESVLIADSVPTKANLQTIIEGNPENEAIGAVLAGYNFRDTRKAAKNLRTIMSVRMLGETREFDSRTRDAFREIAEELLTAIARTPSPDMTLQNFAFIVNAHPFPDQLYKQMREANYRRLLVTVCATSPRFAKALGRNLLLLDMLASDPQSRGDVVFTLQNLVAMKNQEELRAGIRHLLEITSFDELATELTLVADAVVSFVVQDEFRKMRMKKPPIAILALGKYGTREINFDSDLDVLFIAEAKTPATKDKLERIATSIVTRLSIINEEGKLYDIDARLRPEGKSAPLVVDRKAYLAYLSKRASLWERQSLTRLRFVAGDTALGERIIRDVDTIVYDSPLPPAWVEQIISMRKKTESRSRTRDSEFIDIKLGPGGMVDIEFLAQMLQLKYGGTSPVVRHSTVSETLNHLSSLLNFRLQGEELVSTYKVFRRIETLMRLTVEERGSTLPAGERLEVLSRVFNGSDGSEFTALLQSSMKNVRQNFIHLSQALLTKA